MNFRPFVPALLLGIAQCADDRISAPLPIQASTLESFGSHYVAPNGDSTNSGTSDSPWSLYWAAKGAGGVIQPGDTILLRGGIYRGKVIVTVAGSSAARVVFREYPGEEAIIQDSTLGAVSTFIVRAPNLTFSGFEIRNVYDEPGRSSERPQLIYNSTQGHDNTYENLVLHDGGNAFYNEPVTYNVRVTGCIIYNNGWQGADHGHGHGLYLRSNTGPVIASGNVIFNQFGFGIHAYTQSARGLLRRIILEGNTVFNAGTLSSNSSGQNLLLGGSDFATDDTVQSNNTYLPPGVGVVNAQIGRGTQRNGTARVQGNYFVGGKEVLHVGYWGTTSGDFSAEGNTFVGSRRLVIMNDSTSPLPHAWSGNRYWRHPDSLSWRHKGVDRTWADWQLSTGVGSQDSTPQPGMPTTTLVRTSGQFITVYNWGNEPSITVSWPCTSSSRVYNVQDLANAVAATCDGSSLTIPIEETTPPVPVGMTASPAPSTGTLFAVYVVK